MKTRRVIKASWEDLFPRDAETKKPAESRDPMYVPVDLDREETAAHFRATRVVLTPEEEAALPF